MATFLFFSCQPSTETLKPHEGSNDKTSPTEESSEVQKRYDGTPIYSVDTQILKSSKAMNRSIPGIDDSRVTYCESVDGDAEKYNGVRDSQKYPLASLSKMFLSAYAIDKLGPYYTFENIWYLKQVGSETGEYDAYFRANYDPVLNIEKMLYAMAELNKHGVKKIRRLIIDETTRVYLSVLLDPHVDLTEVPVGINKSIENLNIILNSQRWGQQTVKARSQLIAYAHKTQRNLIIPQSFSVQHVSYIQAQKINLKDYTQTVKIKSAPLLKYLKEINVRSNNYMADMLFNTLGGVSEFKRFQQSRLKISSQDLQLYTGSGLAITGMGVRTDSLGSCTAVLSTLKFLNTLSQQLKFNLGHVLLTAGSDQGTYEATQAMAFNQSVVLKTGRLFDVPALNVAGVAQLKSGTLFFSYMAHGFANSQESIYKSKRDNILLSLLNHYPVVPFYQTVDTDGIY